MEVMIGKKSRGHIVVEFSEESNVSDTDDDTKFEYPNDATAGGQGLDIQ